MTQTTYQIHRRQTWHVVDPAPTPTQQQGLMNFMQEFGMVPRPQQLGIESGLPRDLAQAQARTDSLLKEKPLPIAFMGYVPTFSGTKVMRGKSSDWLTMNLKEDPSYILNHNRLVAPKHVAKLLWAMDELGHRFNAIFISHEIPKNSYKLNGSPPLEYLLPPASAVKAERLTKLDNALGTFWDAIQRTVFGIGQATAVTSNAVMTIPAAIAMLDPIIWGLHITPSVQIEGKYLAAWYYLTHWHWNE